MDNRRKIGSGSFVTDYDDISESSGLQLVSDKSSSLDPYQVERLRALCYEKIKSDQESVSFVYPPGFVERICDMCQKPFVCKENELYPVCPHCGRKHTIDTDLQEVHVTNSTERYQELQDKSQGFPVVSPDDAWQDSRKEQISLEPGSPEYQEYLRDLMENSPKKEDDAMHVALETRNEDLVTKGHDASFDDNQFYDDVDNVLDPNDDTVAKRESREITEKLDVHAAVLEALAAMVVVTPTVADDKILRSQSFQYDVLHDRSISADEYHDAVESYVMESVF